MSDPKIKSSEITPESTYLNRRNFIRAGLIAGSSAATALTYRFFNPPPAAEVATAKIESVQSSTPLPAGEKLNTLEEITNYNNFYEFSPDDKRAVAKKAERLVTRPW